MCQIKKLILILVGFWWGCRKKLITLQSERVDLLYTAHLCKNPKNNPHDYKGDCHLGILETLGHCFTQPKITYPFFSLLKTEFLEFFNIARLTPFLPPWCAPVPTVSPWISTAAAATPVVIGIGPTITISVLPHVIAPEIVASHICEKCSIIMKWGQLRNRCKLQQQQVK